MAIVSDANGNAELVPVMVRVLDSAGDLVKEIPVQVRLPLRNVCFRRSAHKRKKQEKVICFLPELLP